jgi:hypothetical protein
MAISHGAMELAIEHPPFVSFCIFLLHMDKKCLTQGSVQRHFGPQDGEFSGSALAQMFSEKPQGHRGTYLTGQGIVDHHGSIVFPNGG